MSKESLGNKNKWRGPHWLVRIAGVTAISAALFAPSTHSLESEPAPFNPGITMELPEPDPVPEIIQPPPPPVDLTLTVQQRLTRDTGMDMPPFQRFKIGGTDLLVPVTLLPDKDGNVCNGFLSGDTFAVAGPYIQDLPPGGDMWRSPTMLISCDTPQVGKPLDFQSAANIDANGVAQEVMFNSHRDGDGHEITVFPNDAIAIPETGEIIMSYQSVSSEITPKNANWATGYSGLAISKDNGQHFERLLTGPDGNAGPGDPVWMNNSENTDPFQMWSMERDGDYVYIISTRSGRQSGPMMLMRAPVKSLTDKGKYECWNGNDFGGDCQPLLPDSKYGEPSMKKLDDGTPEGLWVMSYVDYTYTQLMTRYAKSPSGPWSEPKIQMSWLDLNAMYGGFIIKKGSTPKNLSATISTWQREINKEKYGKYGKLLLYGVFHFNMSVY
jgi:hypothetical protein